MVFYRKYRPQTIADLDNPKLRETLTSVLSAKDVPHSFLFTGPKGLGKTSTARIVAKVLNCTNRKGVEPCNECEQCISITNGSNIDVLEIDGASNRGIDEIRDLRDKVKLAPSSASKKVYIIDEVHMLTTEAFNALLKTIEEPPSHVVFIFCTTEPQKVPATIISRCFHVSLTRATDEELVHSLRRIVESEKLAVDDDALSLIAHLGDGGFRDTQKLFEELVALSGGQRITKAFVEEKAHVGNTENFVWDFLEALAKKDVKIGLSVLRQLEEQGIDSKYFMSELLQAVHGLVLSSVGVTQEKPRVVFSLDELQILVNALQQSYRDSKYAVIPQLPLEMLCIAWCSAEQTTEQTKVIQSISQFSTKPTMDVLLHKERTLKVQSVLGKGEPVVTVVKKETIHTQVDMSSMGTLMDNIIYKVKPFNHSVAGVLRGCIVKSIDDKRLVFETAFKFHKEKLEEQKTKSVLEQAVKEITGKPLQVMIELKAN